MAYTTFKLHKSEYEADGVIPNAELSVSNHLHALIQPGLLLLDQRALLCGLHGTLLLARLPPNWMAYIMQVAGCCGEESKADFSLDACRSVASAYWLNSC